MKYLFKIWPLIIFMMIAPGKSLISNPVVVATDEHDLNLSSISALQSATSAGSFTVEENTILSLNKNARLSINGNIRLNSPILGQGVLVISGDQKLSIDANGHSISRLVINNPQGVELLSPLKIAQELSVEEGFLYLNDFNIQLDHSFVKISTENSGNIAFNGSGRIIGQTLQPLANHAPQNDHDFSSQAFNTISLHQNLYLSGTQIHYHIIQDCHSAIQCPPTPPPD
jgi:hypothetical protein